MKKHATWYMIVMNVSSMPKMLSSKLLKSWFSSELMEKTRVLYTIKSFEIINHTHTFGYSTAIAVYFTFLITNPSMGKIKNNTKNIWFHFCNCLKSIFKMLIKMQVLLFIQNSWIILYVWLKNWMKWWKGKIWL